MKKIVLLYTHILLISLCYSQNNDIHIHFRDRHNENVTAIAVHPSGKYFFTADKTGKIIMWRTSDYSYLKTISDGLGLPVRDLRTTKDGSILLVTEGMQGRGLSDKNSGRYALSSLYYESDTLAAYYPFTDKNPVKKNISCDILGHQSDDIILMAIYDNQEGTLYGFDNDFSKNSYFDYPLEKPVHKAAINTQKQWLAYTCNDLIENTSELFIMSYNTGERLFKKVFRDEILEVVFDDVNPALHIISYQQQNQSLVLYNYNLEKDELIQTDTYVTGLLLYPFVYTQKTDSLSIIIDTEYIEPVILKKENNTLKKIDFNFKANYSNSTAAALIPGTHHLIMWTQIHDYFGPNPELHVFDYQALIDIEKYAVRTLNNASGSFLPGNNWYIEGLEENTSQQLLSAPQKKFIKYYRGGTFSNRFGRLMLKDFMNINYGLELMDDTRFVVDKYSGILVFGAYQAQSLDLKYYLYDLIQNEIDSSFKVKIELHEPLCYRNKAKHILDAGLTSFEGTRDFAIVSPTKTFFYNSHYTHAELSLDGNFIMLCDTSSTVRIFEAGRKKALFEKKLDKMEHINLGAADESSFWLSFSYWDKEERGYFFKSILLEYKEGKYIEQVFPKTSILDIASKNNMFAVLFDNITSRMVFISEDKKLIFSGSELPESLSLNDETDRLMLNFNNGTIRIYDTQTMTLQGTMVHPDSRRHIILTPNGFFSANTDVTPYLYAENNGKIISFESIETLYNKPAEALSVFGQPDIYYTEMLQKTSDIRLKKNSYTSIYKGSHDSAPIIKKILYDGFENTSVSSKKELALNIEFTDSLKGTIHLEIKINGSIVLEKDVTAHTDSFSRIINCEVALVSGENILSVWLTNARGIQSEASEHFILCTADDYTADLYLLAIGVSDYQDNAFNLTFAEKDAMDLSLLYGDTSSVPDVHTFKHKFFGERFTVNIFNKPKRDEEIRYLTEQYGENHFFSNIHQLDYSGYYWIENTDSLYFLWDFKNKNRKRIILPEFNYSSWSLEPLYIPSATDDGFFFKNETGEWFKYIFSENKTVKTNFTKNLKFFYLYDESWITDTIVYDNSAYNS